MNIVRILNTLVGRLKPHGSSGRQAKTELACGEPLRPRPDYAREYAHVNGVTILLDWPEAEAVVVERDLEALHRIGKMMAQRPAQGGITDVPPSL